MRTIRGPKTGRMLFFLVLATIMVIPGMVQFPVASLPLDRDIHIVLSGTEGDNGWYISDVTVGFDCDGEILHIYYQINNGTWFVWTGPNLKISTNGRNQIGYYGVDKNGTVYGPYYEWVNIDKDIPQVIGRKHVGLNEAAFAAIGNDTTSGMNRVEFYLSYGISDPSTWTLLKTDTTPLYCVILNPIPQGNNVTIIIMGYDNAGNSVYLDDPFDFGDLNNIKGIALNPILSTNGTVIFHSLLTICNPSGFWPPYLMLPTKHTLTNCDGIVRAYWIDIYYA